MNSKPCHTRGNRRGALLLLVLMSLVLFMMMGTLMLLAAIRARSTARAFAKAATSFDVVTLHSRAALEEALMLVLRGTLGAPPLGFTESLLEDKYGNSTITGDSATLSGTASRDPILTLTTTTSTNARLNGRIVTLKGRSSNAWTSFRIVGVDGNRFYLANVPCRSALTLQSTDTYQYRINGREFTPLPGASTPETYDAYDDANSWLAQPAYSGGKIGSTYHRLSYLTGASGTSAQVDNDNDGILDGVWIAGTDGFLPPRVSPQGTTTRYRVSYLILDLDGRINVNAVGMARNPSGTAAYGPAIPLGMGYGPADLDASLVVSGSLPAVSGFSGFTQPSSAAPTGPWANVIWGGTAVQAFLPSESQRRKPPSIGVFSGRYGANGKPGIDGDDTDRNQQTAATDPTGTSGTISLYRSFCSGANTAADLKGQLKVYIEAPSGTSSQITPTLFFLGPESTSSNADAIDDPYELRLDARARRPGGRVADATVGVDDSPFTLGELERVLRAGDTDATTLPSRLAAALQDRAQGVAMSITTDSWDAPALTGSAAFLVEPYMATLSYPWIGKNSLSPDTASGLLFNVNRRLTGTSASENRDYLRGLYTLALAVGGTGLTPATAAQWAVNVLDFRDEDSTMTGFEYDTLPWDGWDIDGDVSTSTGQEKDRAVAWGVERPDLLIAETAGWCTSSTSSTSGQLFANLVRPSWKTVLTNGVAATQQARETLAAPLGTPDGLNLAALLPGAKSEKYPIWQLRFGERNVVQLIDPGKGASKPQQQYVLSLGGVVSGTHTVHGTTSSVPALAEGGHLCICGSGTWAYFTVGVGVTRAIIDKGTFFDRDCTEVKLERLADPSRANAEDNPYVVVDRATVNVIQSSTAGVTAYSTLRRRGPKDALATASPLAVFWNSSNCVPGGSVLTAYSSQVGPPDKYVPRFHWPNRPFISHAELSLVPFDTAENLLRYYDFPLRSLASTAGSRVLDATYVPSRFAGNFVSISATDQRIRILGFEQLGPQQFSAWREPGKLNVNTIVSGTSVDVDSDSLVWATLISGTQIVISSGTGSTTVRANPYSKGSTATTGTMGQPTPATSMGQLLSLSDKPDQPIALQIYSSGSALHPRDKNPLFAHAAAIRMANTATIRSNMFAIWITLEITEDSATASATRYGRMFAIIDRSIPVGYSQGEDLNVRDMIRLLRFLD